jgi:hypothetical protein
VDGNWDWPAGSAQAKWPLGGSARLLAEVACVHVFSIFIYFSLFLFARSMAANQENN